MGTHGSISHQCQASRRSLKKPIYRTSLTRFTSLSFIAMRSMNKYNRNAGIIAYPQAGWGSLTPFPVQQRKHKQRGGRYKSFMGYLFKRLSKTLGKKTTKRLGKKLAKSVRERAVKTIKGSTRDQGAALVERSLTKNKKTKEAGKPALKLGQDTPYVERKKTVLPTPEPTPLTPQRSPQPLSTWHRSSTHSGFSTP